MTTSQDLPLGWTHVKRKRPDGRDCDSENCQDPACLRRRSSRRKAPLTSTTVQATSPLISENNTFVISGTAMFCLHESNPLWFQGYFFPPDGASWGILCETQEIDDCLQCEDGGYHVVDMTVYPRRPCPTKTFTIRSVEWTGGDMMRLLHEESKVSFEPEQILTQARAVPLTQAVFGSLIRRLRERSTADEDTKEARPVLDVVPDVAIVMGEMKFVRNVNGGNDGNDDDEEERVKE